MDYGRAIATLFRMDDEAWARHASPWSVYTRIPLFIPLLASIWSHTTLGWLMLIPLVGVLAFAWVNPRLFAPPLSTNRWASKATFGERVWLNRHTIPIPEHHATAAHLLSAVAAFGFVAAVIGAWLNDLLMTLVGAACGLLAKLWFCDRMVWLYEDMKDADPTYRSWLRP
ncbi:MAG: DUF6653 family protein [Hyphomicrobiaceae bacterium]